MFSGFRDNTLIEPSPQLIQMLDQWFEEDPRRLEYFKWVEFTDELNSAAGWKKLVVGEKAYDLYATKQIRDISDPRRILYHEFEHEMDFHISYEEDEELKRIIRTDETARDALMQAKWLDNLNHLYFRIQRFESSKEGARRSMENIFGKTYSTSILEELQEKNREWTDKLDQAEIELYSSLENTEQQESIKGRLENINKMHQRRQQLFDFMFDPNTNIMSFDEGDEIIKEISLLATQIDQDLDDIKMDLEEGGYGEDVTGHFYTIKTAYNMIDEIPTTGVTARMDWRGFTLKTSSLFNDEANAEEIFEEYLADNPQTRRLEHRYSEIVIDASYDIIHDDKLKPIRNRAASQVKQILMRDYGIDFWNIRQRYISEGRRNYLLPKDEFLALSSDDQELILINDAAFYLMLGSQKHDEQGFIIPDSIPPRINALSKTAYALSNLRDGKIQEYLKEASEEVYAEEGGLPPLGSMFELEFLLQSKSIDDPVLSQLSTDLRELYELDHGLPASYGFHNYGNTDKKYSGRYSEIASTYREQPIEERRFKVHEGTPGQREMFSVLTQLAFDAGKMDVEEFVQIMGEDTDEDGMGDSFCESGDCIEYRCVDYKLLCCKEYDNSPNC